MSSQILPLHQTSYLFLATRMGKRQTSLNPGQLILRYIVAVANPPPQTNIKKSNSMVLSEWIDKRGYLLKSVHMQKVSSSWWKKTILLCQLYLKIFFSMCSVTKYSFSGMDAPMKWLKWLKTMYFACILEVQWQVLQILSYFTRQCLF